MKLKSIILGIVLSALASGAAMAQCAGIQPAGSVCGNPGASGTLAAPTRTPSLGVPGSVLGSLGFSNLTSGSITLRPTTGALGTTVLTLPAVTGTVMVDPKTYMVAQFATCNGATDDTTALAALGATIQAAGGNATLVFPAGATCVIYNSGQSVTGTSLFNWTSVNNIRVIGNGATLRVGATFVAGVDVLTIFSLNIVNNVSVDALHLTQAVPVNLAGPAPYGTQLVAAANGSADINLSNSTVTGSLAPYIASNTKGGLVLNVQSIDSFYGTALIDGAGSAFPGPSQGITIRGLSTSNVDRSLFFKGVRDIDASVVSVNARANDILISSDIAAAVVENVRLNYKTLARTSGTGSSYVTIGNASGCACNGAVYRNLRINLDIDASGDPAIYPAVKFIKGSVAALGTIYEDIQIGGRITGIPNFAGHAVELFNAAEAPWSGETANNIVVGPLYMTGSATPDFYVDLNPVSAAGGPVVLRDVKAAQPLALVNGTPGNFAAFNSRFTNYITNDHGQVTTRGDGNYTILATDRVLPITAAFSAARTFTLPAINTMAPGSTIWIMDITAGGALTAANTLTIARAGADTINQGATSITFSKAGSVIKVTASPANTRWDIRQVSTNVVQGDILFADAMNSLTTLAKDTGVKRYISNQGAGNNPVWETVDLGSGIGGILGAGNGGTGVSNGANLTISSATSVGRGQYQGTNTNDSATAGNIGEFVSSVVPFGSLVALTTNVPANMTSITLSAGDWDVASSVIYSFGATTNVTLLTGSISLTTATLDTTPPNFLQINPTNSGAGVVPGANVTSLPTGVRRVSTTGQSVFLVVRCTFTVSTCGAYGALEARRVR